MTSHPRRGNGPVRQHSLQQLPRRHHQVRRQRSAEEDRSLQIRTTDPIRARRDSERSSGIERPKVRIAWGDEARVGADEDPDGRVEVVACQISTGKSRPVPNARQPRIISRNSATDKTCSTLLYSRQELAERLRLAWKQREANKSNIDVFLAHGTTEERSDSRLSSSSSVDRSPVRLSTEVERNYVKTTTTTTTTTPTPTKNEPALGEAVEKSVDTNRSATNGNPPVAGLSRIESVVSSTTLCPPGDAKSKRASFKNATNAAFLQPVNDSLGGFLSSSEIASTTKKDSPRNVPGSMIEQKNRRTNSAPPQRRANSVGSTSRTQVSIVIEAPSICKPDKESTITSSSTEPSVCSSRVSAGLAGRPIKSVPAKRRARSGKRRVNSVAGKDLDGGRAKVGNTESKNAEVVTMVSLVSDADSDSEIEENSPRDDKLISQLRSNLPTTPIIKSNVTTCGSFSSIARRPIKSVSFQQDSIHVEEPENRALRIRPQSVQVGRVTGSALPTPEEARTWRTDVTSLTISNTTGRQHNETQEITEVSLTDREKRCLIVPIGDPRTDKKRKLLRTRSTPPPRPNGVEKQPTMMHHTDTREAPPRTRIQSTIESNLPVQQSPSILLQASVSKLAENVVMTRTESEPELDGESVEPAFQTTKEKECWHLYKRMCDKGVCVSFDTVLRGMLTPTEYRLRRKEMI